MYRVLLWDIISIYIHICISYLGGAINGEIKGDYIKNCIKDINKNYTIPKWMTLRVDDFLWCCGASAALPLVVSAVVFLSAWLGGGGMMVSSSPRALRYSFGPLFKAMFDSAFWSRISAAFLQEKSRKGVIFEYNECVWKTLEAFSSQNLLQSS